MRDALPPCSFMICNLVMAFISASNNKFDQSLSTAEVKVVRFQVLTAASMKIESFGI
jgi:hypothetical protein